MKPERIDVGLLVGVAAFTAVVGVTLVVVAAELPFLRTLNAQTIDGPGQSHGLLTRWLGFVLGVAVVEEVVKALPIYLFVYRKGRDYRPLTFAYVGVVSGLAFGVIEAVGYSYRYADALRQTGTDQIGAYVVVQLLRLISLPLLHACFSAIVGYFIGLATIERQAPRVLMGLGVLLSALLHGTYNTFSGGWIGIGVAALTILVFLSYVRTGDLISKEIAKGLEPAEPETILMTG